MSRPRAVEDLVAARGEVSVEPAPNTDRANADRFISQHGASVRWCEALGGWLKGLSREAAVEVRQVEILYPERHDVGAIQIIAPAGVYDSGAVTVLLAFVALAGIRPVTEVGAQTASASILRAATATERAQRMRPPLPTPGNPDGGPIPAWAGPVDTSQPDRTIGNGTPASCTSRAVVDAVARGGVIRFDCGPDPVTIILDQTAKVFNDTGPEIVIDGGGLVRMRDWLPAIACTASGSPER